VSVYHNAGNASKLKDIGSCSFHRQAAQTPETLVFETSFHILGRRVS